VAFCRWTGVDWDDLTGFQLRDESEVVGSTAVATATEPLCSPVHIDNHSKCSRNLSQFDVKRTLLT
jgi:hypothetical protein